MSKCECCGEEKILKLYTKRQVCLDCIKAVENELEKARSFREIFNCFINNIWEDRKDILEKDNWANEKEKNAH